MTKQRTLQSAVRMEVDHLDMVATRGDHLLYAEAKGRTGKNGPLDVDRMDGQLLRSMPNDEVSQARFAVVVPEETAMQWRENRHAFAGRSTFRFTQ